MENITEKDCEAKISHAKLKLRFRYCVGILIAIITLVFAYFFSGNNALVSIVSFAATIASIVLSVLAIFMTVLSNDSITNLLHRFRDTCDNIGTINNTVKAAAKDIKSSSEKFEEIKPTLNSASESIKISVNELKDSTTNFKKSNDLIKETLEQFEGRLKIGINDSMKDVKEEIENVKRIMETSKSDSNKSQKEDLPQSSTNTFQLSSIENSSYYGYCLILLLIYTSKHSTEVNLDKFGEEILKNKSCSNYLHGFGVALSSLNFLDIFCLSNESSYKIEYNQNDEDVFKKRLFERANELYEGTNSEEKDFYSQVNTTKMILNIDNFALNGKPRIKEAEAAAKEEEN